MSASPAIRLGGRYAEAIPSRILQYRDIAAAEASDGLIRSAGGELVLSSGWRGELKL